LFFFFIRSIYFSFLIVSIYLNHVSKDYIKIRFWMQFYSTFSSGVSSLKMRFIQVNSCTFFFFLIFPTNMSLLIPVVYCKFRQFSLHLRNDRILFDFYNNRLYSSRTLRPVGVGEQTVYCCFLAPSTVPGTQ
jgi:hypothetical protein